MHGRRPTIRTHNGRVSRIGLASRDVLNPLESAPAGIAVVLVDRHRLFAYFADAHVPVEPALAISWRSSAAVWSWGLRVNPRIGV